MKRLLTGLAVILALLVAACVTTRTIDADTVLLQGVPFFKQEAYQCGPAALAAVIDYWHRRTGTGNPVTPEEIVADIFSPSARGVLGLDLERYARKQGFQTSTGAGGLEQIKNNIDGGIPPIILVDYGMLLYQANHFLVITGYAKNGVLANTGKRENEFIKDETLESIWKKTGYWMLVIRP